MSSCPALEQIELLAAGRLAGEQAARVRSHLESCSRCAEQHQECRANQDFAAELQARLGSGSTVGFPPAASPPGDASTTTPAIPGYRLVREIHRGGQGVVYEAFQESTRRRVALKVMLGGPFAAEASKRRFEREVELAASLNHPNIVTIHDSGISSGAYYFAMDYVDGVRLDDYARGHRPGCAPSSRSEGAGPTPPLSIPDTLQLFATVSAAVNYAHQRGVIHRDLKPSNILVDADGQPHVLDFGLAKQTADARTRIDPTLVSLEGHVLGTLAYMSPEHTAGVPAEIDVRSDVYSLGVILYELLTGTFPYPVTGLMAEVFENITSAEPRRPSAISRRIDDEVETIVLKALSKPKDRRYQTAGDLAADLQRYLAGETIEAKRDSGWYVLKKTLRRYRLPVGVAAAFVVVVTAALVITTASLRQARRDHARAEWQSYLANIHAADSAVRLHDAVEARIRLEQIPEKFHANWEWRHLHTRLDQSIATLRGHTDTVDCVAFSPDGTWLASASSDKTMRIWDVAAGEEQCVLTAHRGPVRCVAVSPDGTHIASGSDDHTVRLWNAKTGRERATLAGPPLPVSSVAFSPDGNRIAAGFISPDPQKSCVGVWDTATRDLLFAKRAHKWPVNDVGFSSDGARVVSGGEDRYIKVWDSSTGDVRTSWRAHDGGVTSIAISPDGAQIVSAAKDYRVKLWNAETGEPVWDASGHTQIVNSVVFSPDGKLVASASHDKTIRLWNTVTGDQTVCLTGHTDQVNSVAFAPDGVLIASASSDETLKLWDATRTEHVSTLRAYSEAVGKNKDKDVHAIAFSPDGTTVVSATRDGMLRLWDARTHEELDPPLMDIAGEVRGAAFFPDSRRVVSATHVGEISVWDVGARERMRTLSTAGRSIKSIVTSPDGNQIGCVGEDDTLTLRDARTGQAQHALSGHSDRVYGIVFSPDGTRVASSSCDMTVKLWDTASGAHLRTLKGHAGPVTGVAFSPDGEVIASASADRTLKLWLVRTGEELDTVSGHSDTVNCVAFSPDGRRILSGGADQTIRLWDAATGDALITLRGHNSGISAASFSPNGSLIASGDSSGQMKLWATERPEASVANGRAQRQSPAP